MISYNKLVMKILKDKVVGPNFKLLRYYIAGVALLLLNFSLIYWGLFAIDSAHLLSIWELLALSLLVGLTPAFWICMLLNGAYHDWIVPLAQRIKCNSHIDLDC